MALVERRLARHRTKHGNSGELSEFSEVSNTVRILPPEPPATAPNLLTNGSFEENPPWRPYTTLWGGHSLPGWRVVGHSIDWVGSFWGASNGGYSLDLNGLWAGGVEQEIVTEPGRFYFVYYALAANPECEPYWKTFRISAAGEDHSVLLNSYGRSRWNLRWTEPEPFVFQADSDRTTLQLLSTGARGNGACGPTVDDVRVRAAG